MSIGFAGSEDLAQIKEIYHACFPEDPDAFWDLELGCRMEADNILVYREGERILSTVQILSEFLTLGEETYPVQYIYAAATRPEAQGRGLMGELLQHAHGIAKARAQRFSVLITQNDGLFAFYARFGYGDQSRVGCLAAESSANVVGSLRKAEAADIPRMLELYQQVGKGLLAVRRTEKSFAQQCAVYGNGALVYERQGTVTAYGFKAGDYMLEAAGPDARQLLAAAGVAEGATVPEDGMPMRRNGCVLPLDPEAEVLLKQQNNIVYLNLMWN